MTASRKRTLAVLVPSHRPEEVASLANHIVEQMSGNAYFPAPSPTLAQIGAEAAALMAAQVATMQRTVGTTGARNRALGILLADLQLLKGYVQRVADADPEHAVVIIESSGFSVKRPTSRSKSIFEVRHGALSGTVVIVVRAAGKRVAYHWQYSEDGEHWIDLPITLKAKTTVDSLTPGKAYYFRFAVTTKDGIGRWSDARRLIVV